MKISCMGSNSFKASLKAVAPVAAPAAPGAQGARTYRVSVAGKSFELQVESGHVVETLLVEALVEETALVAEDSRFDQ